MSVVRVAAREVPYVQIANATVRDKRLSWEASGLLAFLLSQPPGFEVSPEDLAAERDSAGRDKVYRMLRELRAAGYASYVEHRSSTGRVVSTEYVVREQPVPGKPDPAKPDAYKEQRRVPTEDEEHSVPTEPGAAPPVEDQEEKPDNRTPAQKVIAAYADYLHAKGLPRPDDDAWGQVCRHVRAAIVKGYGELAVKAGIWQWHKRRLHPSKLPDCIRAEAAGQTPDAARDAVRAELDARAAATRERLKDRMPVGEGVVAIEAWLARRHEQAGAPA